MKKFSFIIAPLALGLFILLVSPFFQKSQIAQAIIQDSKCTNTGGTCQDTGTYCPGGYGDNYCPSSGNNVKCCFPTSTSCYKNQTYGKCQTPNGSQPGSSGAYVSGYCPGGSDIKCFPGQMIACPSESITSGNILSLNKQTSASNTYAPQNASSYAVDGNTLSAWNAGNYPPQWIEINLGGKYALTGMKFTPNLNPGGYVTNQIYVGTASGPTTLARTITCTPTSGSQYSISLDPNSATNQNVQYIRVLTTTGPSWVAWNEITAYGLTPTPTPTPTPKPFSQSTTTPGIIFTGNYAPNFGSKSLAASSVKRWVVGGLTYPEIFATTTTSTTSYQYLLNRAIAAQLTPVLLSSKCTLSNCTLPDSLAHGVYRADGDLTLNAHTFLANNNYVILVDGNLTIQGNIVIPSSSTVLFSAKNDITVAKTVGAASNTYPPPPGQIQGLYSANHDFVIDGINNCVTGPDKMLNIEGAIITNAGGTNGKLVNNRDLCAANFTTPSFTVRSRLDFLLNLPKFVMQQRTTFKETAP